MSKVDFQAIVEHCLISKICYWQGEFNSFIKFVVPLLHSKQVSFLHNTVLIYAMKEMDWWPCNTSVCWSRFCWFLSCSGSFHIVAERLALPTSDHGVAGSNPAGGDILPEPKRRFIAQSLSCSPFHRHEMTEILLKGRKTLTHPSIISYQMSLVMRKPVFGVLDKNWPAQPQSLARGLIFRIVRIEKLDVLYYLSSEQQRRWSDCTDWQADLRLCCLHMSWTGFLMMWLKSSYECCCLIQNSMAEISQFLENIFSCTYRISDLLIIY